MSSCDAILDSDIFSEILKGRNAIVLARERSFLAEGKHYALSAISIMEVIQGLQKIGAEERIQTLLHHLRSIEVLPLDLPCAELAGRIWGDLERSGQTIGVADPMVAAVTIHHGATLITGNVVHYERIQRLGYRLRLDNWKEPQLAGGG
jgi:tRNA(fMet)-specific endonuclease VapC